MTPSLTPHEDAAKAACAQRPAPKNDYEQRCYEAIEAGLLQFARIIDSGKGTRQAMSFAVSIATTLIDSVASSAAVGEPDEEAQRKHMINMMLGGIMNSLAIGPSITTKADVQHSPSGAA